MHEDKTCCASWLGKRPLHDDRSNKERRKELVVHESGRSARAEGFVG